MADASAPAVPTSGLPPPVRLTPLAHRTPVKVGAVAMAERPYVGKFILRANPFDAVEKLRDAFGFGLPFDPLTSSTLRETAFLWLGPDEWLFVTAPDEAEERSARARRALTGFHHQLVDVSDYYTMVEISGAQARALLMKLTTLDLHRRAFRNGMVAGGVFGRANAWLWQSGDDDLAGGPVFRLFVRWSMADYLWCLLAAAGREWGVPPQVPLKGETLTVT